MIKNTKLKLSISRQNLIKYGYGMQNNIITFTFPTGHPKIEVELKIHIDSINNYEIKKMFAITVLSDNRSLLQFRNKIKTALNKGV